MLDRMFRRPGETHPNEPKARQDTAPEEVPQAPPLDVFKCEHGAVALFRVEDGMVVVDVPRDADTTDEERLLALRHLSRCSEIGTLHIEHQEEID